MKLTNAGSSLRHSFSFKRAKYQSRPIPKAQYTTYPDFLAIPNSSIEHLIHTCSISPNMGLWLAIDMVTWIGVTHARGSRASFLFVSPMRPP